MRYFKKIEIDSFNEIVSGTLKYLKTEVPDIYNRSSNTTYYPLNLQNLLAYCPELETAFDRYKLKCKVAVAFIMYSNKHCRIHVDSVVHNARINIPIENCIGTITMFFTGGEYEQVQNPITKTHAKKLISNANIKMVNYVEIDSPTVIRVNEPHTVFMNEKHAPRITLSLGFDIDPVFLLEDSIIST